MLSNYQTHITGIGGVSLSTAQTYLYKLKNFKAWFGSCLSTVIQADISCYIVYLKQTGTNRNTIRLSITAIKSFFSWYCFYYNKSDPTQGLKTIKPQGVSYDIISLHDAEALIVEAGLQNADQLRNAAIICILADTGIRVGELVNLKLGDIRLEKKQFKVNVRSTKTYQDRIIPFCYLKQGGLISETFSAYWQSIKFANSRSSEDYLFKTSEYYQKKFKKDSSKLNRGTINYLINKLTKSAKLDKRVTPHSFRHFYATYLAVNGEKIEIIQARLGHQDINKTKIYIHYADLVQSESAKNTPLANIKTNIKGFSKNSQLLGSTGK